MNPFVFGMKEPAHGWLEPSVHELIGFSRQEATLRGATEVSLEHFLLGTLVQNNKHTLKLFMVLGVDPTSLRERILERLGLITYSDTYSEYVPLSQDLQLCLDIAIAATHACNTLLLAPEPLLLCVLSNQWKLASDKLIERLQHIGEWKDLIPLCMELAHQERRMMFYIQYLVHFLSRSQEPAISFHNLMGMDAAKQELQKLIALVIAAPELQRVEKRKPQEVLLIGSSAQGKQLAEAVAFEVGTRLLSFSFAGLLTMCAPFSMYMEVKRLKDQSFSARENHFSRHGRVFAQSILQRFFLRAHHMSPCILLIEDIDASEVTSRTRIDDSWQQLLAFLFAEIELLTEGGQIIILATATLGIDGPLQRLQTQGLLHTSHFERRLIVDERGVLDAAMLRTILCPTCEYSILPGWKHCAYCGAFLANACPNCGLLRPGIAGSRFCFECGYRLE